LFKEELDLKEKIKKCSKLKIIIKDKSENKTIKIPSIPFWLLDILGNTAIKFVEIAFKYKKSFKGDEKYLIEVFKEINLHQILNELKNYGQFDLVYVEDREDEIKISVI